MVLTVSFVLSPVIGLSCHRRFALAAKLDASVEASGPHDFAVRVSAIRQKHQPRPPHPVPNVRDDRDTPPMWDGMARLIVLIWVRPETECFFKWDWTAQIRLIRLNKFRSGRTRRTTAQGVVTQAVMADRYAHQSVRNIRATAAITADLPTR